MKPGRLILFLGAIVIAGFLAWQKVISGDAWLTLALGLLLPSPLEGRKRPGGGLTLPLLCLLLLGGHSACKIESGLEVGGCTSWRARGVATDHISIKPQASNPVPAGQAGVYADSSDNLLRFVDTAGAKRIAGEAWQVRQSAGTPGSPTAGWIWYDTVAGAFVGRDGTGNVTFANAGAYVTVATSQTITGAKTWDAAAVFNGAVTLGDAAADVIGVLGALRIYNSAGTFYVSLTHAATANRAVTLPDAAGAILLDSSTINASQIGAGDIAAARINNALTAPGPIGSGTPNTGAFSTLAVAGAPTAATFFRTCTLTSAAAATPVVCLAAADVPASLSAKLAKWSAYVNGGSGWGTVTSCVIEDTAGNDLISMAMAALAGDTFIDDGSANVTKEARYRLGTGGAVDEGLQISCNANGTGSDLVVVLSGSIQ